MKQIVTKSCSKEWSLNPLRAANKQLSIPLNKLPLNSSQEDFLNSLQSITSDIDAVQKNVSQIKVLQKRIIQAITTNPKVQYIIYMS